MPERPTVVTVFGWLNLGFGAYGLFALAASAVFLFGLLSPSNPVVALMQTGAYRAYTIGSMFFGALAGLALMAGGVGLLQSQRWGRTLTLGYAYFTIVNGLVGAVVTFVYLLLPLMDNAASTPETAGAIGGAVGALFGTCFSLLYPGALIYGMSRRDLRDYLDAVDAPEAGAGGTGR